VQAPHQYATQGLVKLLSSSALVGLGGGGVWIKNWGITAKLRILPDQIVTSISEVTTVDFCITNLRTPCITVYRNGKYIKCHDHTLYLQSMISIINTFMHNFCCKPHLDRVGVGCYMYYSAGLGVVISMVMISRQRVLALKTCFVQYFSLFPR
jgi:hypothetical protein